MTVRSSEFRPTEFLMKRCVRATSWWAIAGLFGLVDLAPFALLSGRAADPSGREPHVLFGERFDDSRLLERGWYDGVDFTISNRLPYAGQGCIEYAWKTGATKPASSSGVRHLFEATDTVSLRCYIKLSKCWGWTGRAYHPHLMHFMTTENEKFAGPAASHLTVYIELWNGKLRLASQDIQNKDMPHGLTQGPLKGVTTRNCTTARMHSLWMTSGIVSRPCSSSIAST